jgi:hypothetical protein
MQKIRIWVDDNFVGKSNKEEIMRVVWAASGERMFIICSFLALFVHYRKAQLDL